MFKLLLSCLSVIGIAALLFSPINTSGTRNAEIKAFGSEELSEVEKAGILESFGKLPLYFIRNDGQMDKRVKYYERGSGRTMFFAEDGVYLSLGREQNRVRSRGV